MTNEVSEVKDIPTENGVKINNILTFLVLSVMTWVGYNINTMKIDIAEMNGFLKTHDVRISRNEDDIKDINVKIDGNVKRINQLEIKNGR